MLKQIEKLIDKHIRENCLIQSLFDIEQHADQPGKFCNIAFYQLMSKIRITLENLEIALQTEVYR